MLSVEYYHKLKNLYRKEVSKSRYIYIYTVDSEVEKVMFSLRNKRNKMVEDVPHDKLLLSRDIKNLPKNVIVQVKFEPLTFTLF